MKKIFFITVLLISVFGFGQEPVIEWQKSLGGSGYDNARSIQQTSDGGFIIVGFSFSDDGDLTVNNGAYDYWIIKTDSIGEILWQKSYGGSGGDYAESAQQTTDGGYIVSGRSGSYDGDITNFN